MSAESPGACDPPGARWGPIASCLGVVKSLPFEARFEMIVIERDLTGANSETRVTGSIYRDRTGCVRSEYRLHISSGEAVEITAIVDQAAGTVIALDIAAKMATIFTDMGPSPGGALCEGWAFSGAWSLERPAVERVIEGISCRRVKRVGWPLGSALKSEEEGKLWVSDELKHSVLERVSDSQREHTWRLYNIRRVEPLSSLFVVPAGYAEVVVSGISKAPPNR